MGTTTCNASRSCDGNGPSGRRETSSSVDISSVMAATASESSRVTPPSRSNTTSAGISSGDWKAAIRSRTSVDSAPVGSQAALSFSWACVSLPAGPMETPATTSQKTSTIQALTLRLGSHANQPTSLCRVSAMDDCSSGDRDGDHTVLGQAGGAVTTGQPNSIDT